MKSAEFQELKGKVIKSITGKVDDDEIHIICYDGSEYKLYHDQKCCESVYIESIVGDLNDLIGSPVILAEEATSEENPDGVTMKSQDIFTWTFYKLATIKGYVDIRWYGESNGEYSVSVDFIRL